MSDQIPSFRSFVDDARDVPKLAASEVRRRGDRRRATRRAAVATTAIAAVAAMGFGVVQLSNLGADGVPAVPAPSESPSASESPTPDSTPSESPSPSESSSPSESPQPAVTADLLPTGEEMGHPQAPSVVLDEYEGLGQAAKDICDPGVWGDPTSSVTREYGAGEDYPPYIHAMLLQYASADDAATGMSELHEGYAACAERLAGNEELSDASFHDVTDQLPVDTAAIPADPTKVTYGTFGALVTGADEGHFGQVLIAQLGDRVLWVSQDFIGQDDNCSIGHDPDLEQCTIPRSTQTILERAAGE